jgi:hypothetical protein
LDLVSAADVGKISLTALLGLSAAFDTVDHNIVYTRLQKEFGFSTTVADWFASYLFNRRQSVKCGGIFCCASMVQHGVPQGSVLGPLLILL